MIDYNHSTTLRRRLDFWVTSAIAMLFAYGFQTQGFFPPYLFTGVAGLAFAAFVWNPTFGVAVDDNGVTSWGPRSNFVARHDAIKSVCQRKKNTNSTSWYFRIELKSGRSHWIQTSRIRDEDAFIQSLESHGILYERGNAYH